MVSGPLIRLFAILALLAAVPATCSDKLDQPGQVNFPGTLTVLNRTTAELTVASGQRQFSVPACSEATEDEFPLNWWTVTSPGRDTFHSGGGDYGPHSYLIVTSVVLQQDERPDPLPPCQGLLQPAQH